ncbi:ribonuclease 3-like protein 3 [Rutidosis leptorrhynchoides]|uniref:ribonuclease 3-like protein 3 n=1 Tax=Rutidosis leptorrhynchoides TaxID=125765 RepID=UPI003A9A2AF4
MEEQQEEDQTIASLILAIRNLDLSDHEPVTVTSSPQSAPVLTPVPELPSLAEVEEIIGYTFRNKDLLKNAFTDASYKATDCASFERLEYLGDSVLNHLIAKLHYLLYPEMAPGELTRLRAANVDTEALARVALKYNLHKYLRHRKPVLDGQIQEFMEGIVEYPSHSSGMIDPPKVLADILESLIGAIFIDTNSSMDVTWEVVERLLQPLITPENLKPQPVAKFNEACQKMKLKPKAKDMWSKTGEIEIYIDNELIGTGMYKWKKAIAVNRAADDAYKHLFDKFGNKDGGNGG